MVGYKNDMLREIASCPPSLNKEVYECLTDILKCKWALAILDAIAHGIRRPGQIQRNLPGLTPKVFQERIRKLERYGLIYRVTYPEVPPRVEYYFTSRGERFLELLEAVHAFSQSWEQTLSESPRISQK